MTNTHPAAPVQRPTRSNENRKADSRRIDLGDTISVSIEESPLQNATRILQDVAQDVQGPLHAARQSIRMVRDGQFGSISEQQQSLLAGALDQCDVIDSMVGELKRHDLRTSEVSRGHRRWMDLESVVASIVRSTESIRKARRVGLQIDNTIRQRVEIYVDPSSINRLMNNLIVCATRFNHSGLNICLRLESEHHGGDIRWNIIDKGPGIDSKRLQQLTQKGVSMSGSAGLSWTIARRLATAAYSTLSIRSCVGRGTSVSFTTPAGSAAAVAGSYARWRLATAPIGTKPRRRTDAPDSMVRSRSGGVEGQRPASEPPSSPIGSIELGPEWRRPNSPAQAMVGTVAVGAMVNRESVRKLETVLLHAVSAFDFFFKLDDHRYIYCLDTTPRRASERMETISSHIAHQLTDMRLQWSEPSPLAIDRQGWVTKLSDLVVCQSLSGTASPSVVDRDDIRPGTEAFDTSKAAAERLDAEIRHLGIRLDQQTAAMRAQAAKLRRTH